MNVLRVPINVASRKGVSWLAETSAGQPVMLTKFGNPVAVVSGQDTIDKAAEVLARATQAVIEAAATAAAQQADFKFSLEDVCDRLGLDADEIRANARELSRQ